mgnify:CR=1 FL=1|tara:strand:- start:170 stop:724 length:555 start_codon:yes stop_codon:yes gene_type:complete
MTAFDRAWDLLKNNRIRSKIERNCTPEEIQSIANENRDITASNPMVWDYDPSVLFPRECSFTVPEEDRIRYGYEWIPNHYCPHGSTITDFVTGMPIEPPKEYPNARTGICSICMNEWIHERQMDSMEMQGYFGTPPEDSRTEPSEMKEARRQKDAEELEELGLPPELNWSIDQKRFRDNLEGLE